MNPMINKLYQVKNGGELSPQECQRINAELSIMDIRGQIQLLFSLQQLH